ncbi:HEPN domain-containing protein [Candidatus Pacearchaeota archaeon]|nr:HEPN domain-containing protein [Candidatus Pacearchaeota archaeon]
MDEKRIKLAESNFNRYLRDGLLKKESFEEVVYQTYLKNAEESLNVANEALKNKTSYLWVVVCSYYSMFYIASAYLYKKGYKAGQEIVHQVINEALIVLSKNDLEKHFLEEYEEEKDKALAASENLLKDYEFERIKRSRFQYETTEAIKEEKAKTSLERAKNFTAVIRNILEE